MYHAISASDSVLSPWHPTPFSISGVGFYSLGHAVAYYKAEFFQDTASAKRILNTLDAKACATISRGIGSSDDPKWQELLRKVIWHCTKERTLQSPLQVAALILTQGKPIAFCAPNERIWGVGFPPGDPALSRPDPLPGANLFGKALTHVRDRLLESLFPLVGDNASRKATNRERAIAMATTHYYVAKAAEIWGRDFDLGEVKFTLRGKAAGKAYWPALDVNYNERLYLENFQHFIENTVPHEVAHIISFQLHGPNAPAHGKEWKGVMEALGTVPSTYHNYSTVNTGSHRGKRVIASCGHKVYLLSPQRARQTLSCTTCHRPLRPLWTEPELTDALEKLRQPSVAHGSAPPREFVAIRRRR